MTKQNIIVFISGRGSNLVAILESIKIGLLNANVVCVISNNNSALGLEVVRSLQIPTYIISQKGLSPDDYTQSLIKILSLFKFSLICLAGYNRILPSGFVRVFNHRILNIHPSLLPSFPGLQAQAQAIEYGVKYSGCTVHFVDEELDTGPIISQAIVPVFDSDTPEILANRILIEEHKLYPSTIEKILQNSWEINGRLVTFS